jgi:hypothetical protein
MGVKLMIGRDNNNNNLLQYCHMKNFIYNSSSQLCSPKRGCYSVFMLIHFLNPFMVFVLKLWMTKYSSIRHCLLLLYQCCMHICNDSFLTCSNNAWSICSDFLHLLYLTHSISRVCEVVSQSMIRSA